MVKFEQADFSGGDHNDYCLLGQQRESPRGLVGKSMGWWLALKPGGPKVER